MDSWAEAMANTPFTAEVSWDNVLPQTTLMLYSMGLGAGEQVVVDGQQRLQPGAPVRATPAAAAAPATPATPARPAAAGTPAAPAAAAAPAARP